MGSFDLGDYVDVPTRIAEFAAKHPEGSLRCADLEHPYRVETIGDRTFIVYVAAAYRTPDDPTPGIGSAWEPFPGKTPYTKDSELQNAETSAWGRAVTAVLAADTRRGIASAEDVRNRRADQSTPDPVPCDSSWDDVQDRDDVWRDLKAATAALDAAQAAEVRAGVKALGFTKSTFTTEHAALWEKLLPAASEHPELLEFGAPLDMADQS